MAEGPRDALVSRNSATISHRIVRVGELTQLSCVHGSCWRWIHTHTHDQLSDWEQQSVCSSWRPFTVDEDTEYVQNERRNQQEYDRTYTHTHTVTTATEFISDRVSTGGNAIASVRLSVFTLTSEQNDLWSWPFARIRVTTGLKVKVRRSRLNLKSQGQR